MTGMTTLHRPLQDLFLKDTAIHCVHCRAEQASSDPSENLLRCSRCKAVYYCDRDCQKANFGLHKAWCKQVDQARTRCTTALREDDDGSGTIDETPHNILAARHQYELGHTIMELGFRFTDTIVRGKSIYEAALLEFYKAMRLDPSCIGACESVVLLLAMLGYDDLCESLIFGILKSATCTTDSGEGDNTTPFNDTPLEVWIFDRPSETESKILSAQYGSMRDEMPPHLGVNVFLVPLMLIKMRQQSQMNHDGLVPPDELQDETVQLAREVEFSADFVLPVLRSLFPDSRQRWGSEEACALFAHVDYLKPEAKSDPDNDDDSFEEYKPNLWEQHCHIFWMMLQDCYAFTPGILDVVNETMAKMTAMGKPAIPEDPPDTPTVGEYKDFIEQMAEQQRQQRGF